MKLVKVFEASRSGQINPESDPFGGHQILVNVANALYKREIKNQKLRELEDVWLSPKQKAALDYWYNLAK